MAIYQKSENVLRVTEVEYNRIRQAFNRWLTEHPNFSRTHSALRVFLEVEDCEIVFGQLDVWISDPAQQLKFKFDWSA